MSATDAVPPAVASQSVSAGFGPYSVPRRYGIAVLAVAVGIGIRVMLMEPLGDRLIYLTLYPAVMIAAISGGFGPGALAALLSVAAVLARGLGTGAGFRGDLLDWIGMGIFLACSVAIAGFAGYSHRARRRLNEQTEVLAATTARLEEELRHQDSVDARYRETEQRFRLAASSNGITLYEQDNALRYTWLHSQDLEATSVLGRTDAELLPDPEGRELMQRKLEVMAQGVSQRIEIRAPLQGEVRYYDTFITPRRDVAGRIVGVAGTALDITERKHREQGQQLLAAIVENSEDAILALDLRGTITSWNRGAARLFGYAVEEAVGQPVTILIPPERHHEEPRLLERIRQGERINHYETRRRRKDGTELEISLAVSPLRNAVGEIVGASKIARDVTQRNRLERGRRFLAALTDRLGSSEDPAEMVELASRLIGRYLEAQRCCFAEWDASAGQVIVGHEWRQGGEGSAVGAHPLCELGPPRWRNQLSVGLAVTDVTRDAEGGRFAARYQKLGVRSFAAAGLLRKTPRPITVVVAMDSPREWREDELFLLRTAAERVWPLVERARSEAALRASERQLRLITDYAPVSLAQIDRDRRLKFVNQTYARRFGREARSLIGAYLPDVVGAAVYEQIRPHLDAAFAGRHVEFETDIVLPGAGRRWVHAIYTPETVANGEVAGIIALISDVTRRKEAEQEVALARDQALAASRAKDDFLAALSHELRTPLNPVLLIASEAAENAALPPEVRRDFATIRKNVELEARLIDDLLDVTRITHGRLPLDVRVINGEAVLQDALSVIRPDAEQKRITLSFDVAANRTHVRGDAVRLQQVFWNVLKNAVKFTPAGGRITVDVDNGPRGETMRVIIRDNGIGMTPPELARVFDAFAQGDHAAGASSHRFGGLGLGLTISRLLVEQHGGSIQAESPGRGSGATFTIELPVTAEVPHPTILPEGSASLRPPSLDGRAGTARGRVLLVEDHAPTRDAVASLLRRRNYEVLTAGSIAEARTQLSTGGIGLLISDIGLPDGDGCELMQEVRDRPGLRGIALTGYGMDADIARSTKAGFFAHLTKPIRVQALDAVLSAASAVAGIPRAATAAT